MDFGIIREKGVDKDMKKKKWKKKLKKQKKQIDFLYDVMAKLIYKMKDMK